MADLSGFRYPLSAPMETGLEDLNRLGLTTEATAHRTVDYFRPFGGLAISGHAPYLIGDQRLNYAAPEAEYREHCLGIMLEYVRSVSEFTRLKQVNIHPAPRHWVDKRQATGRTGDYDLMIDSIRQIADLAATLDIEIVVENNNVYWERVSKETPVEEIDWDQTNQAFGTSPEEWVGIYEDVAHPNVTLCLDSSHVCTYAHTFPPEDRIGAVMEFLSRPELIKHVHWNDNYLYDTRGRYDCHASVGKGSMPLELHKAIKGLDSTILLEHFYTLGELEEELEYVAGL